MVFFLFFNAFIWYYMTLSVINTILTNLEFTYTQSLVVLAVYHAAVMGSSIVGSFLSDKIKRLRFFYLWTILGTVASLLPAFINNFTMTNILSACFLWGISFGLGMPSCLAYFADLTIAENRGHVSAIIFLITNMSIFPVRILFRRFDLIMSYVTLTIWRGLGLITLFLLKPKIKTAEMRKPVSFVSSFHDRRFVLYLIPWLMFCFIDRFEEPVLRPLSEPDFLQPILMIAPIAGSLSALVGGVLSDWIGRKRVIIYGFVALGLAYAMIGLAPTFSISWYFFFIIDAIAWGVFLITFVLVLWGDLSQPDAREKYYAIGNIPYFLTGVVQLFSTAMTVPAYAAFSLASFFLFLAVLPLLYAPETLPEKKIELRRLRTYVEEAKKVKEKYGEKGAKD